MQNYTAGEHCTCTQYELKSTGQSLQAIEKTPRQGLVTLQFIVYMRRGEKIESSACAMGCTTTTSSQKGKKARQKLDGHFQLRLVA